MALLAWLRRGAAMASAATALVACYQPSVRDCTVSCARVSDCAGDQVCGASGWCAAPDVACSSPDPDAAGVDGAATDGSDGDGMTPIDAPMMIDAGADLRIVISGRGSVATDQPGVNCQTPPGDCAHSVAPGTVVTLTAIDGPGNNRFVDWTTPNCMGMGRTCVLTVSSPVTLVSVEFN